MDDLERALNWARTEFPAPSRRGVEGVGYTALSRALTEVGFPARRQMIMRWHQRGKVPPWWRKPISMATRGEVEII
jgi:hypothetical protein